MEKFSLKPIITVLHLSKTYSKCQVLLQYKNSLSSKENVTNSDSPKS